MATKQTPANLAQRDSREVQDLRALERTIEHPALGDRLTFLRTTQETGGDYLLCQVELPPRSATEGAMHYHLSFVETFEVLEGQLNLLIDGRHRVLKAGQKAQAPKGARHRFWNASDAPVVYTTEMRPARNFEKSLRIAYGLARDGKTFQSGLPKNVFHLALLFQLSESYATGIPLIMQKALFGAIAKIATWIGADKALEKYV